MHFGLWKAESLPTYICSPDCALTTSRTFRLTMSAATTAHTVAQALSWQNQFGNFYLTHKAGVSFVRILQSQEGLHPVELLDQRWNIN